MTPGAVAETAAVSTVPDEPEPPEELGVPEVDEPLDWVLEVPEELVPDRVERRRAAG